MNIIFCGGGTMGSVTPLVAAIEELKKLKPEMTPVWVGTKAGVERAFIAKLGYEYHWIAAGKLRRYFDLRTLLVPFQAAVAIAQCIWLVAKLAPRAVVVSGSFVQVPLVMVAGLFGVPVFLHQEDVEVGVANQMSARDARTITATFEASAPQFGKRKVLVIGNPARRAVVELADPARRAEKRAAALRRWGFDAVRPTLLVLGGGTGALGLNERVAKNIEALLAAANVLLLTGKGKSVEVKPHQNFATVEFLDEMEEAFAVADLAVSRAGLGTLSELGVLGLPAVLVPLPGHQEKNAAYLRERDAALIVANDAPNQVFVDAVLRLLNDRDRRLALGQAIAGIFPADAAAKLARIILEKIC